MLGSGILYTSHEWSAFPHRPSPFSPRQRGCGGRCGSFLFRALRSDVAALVPRGRRVWSSHQPVRSSALVAKEFARAGGVTREGCTSFMPVVRRAPRAKGRTGAAGCAYAASQPRPAAQHHQQCALAHRAVPPIHPQPCVSLCHRALRGSLVMMSDCGNQECAHSPGVWPLLTWFGCMLLLCIDSSLSPSSFLSGQPLCPVADSVRTRRPVNQPGEVAAISGPSLDCGNKRASMLRAPYAKGGCAEFPD